MFDAHRDLLSDDDDSYMCNIQKFFVRKRTFSFPHNGDYVSDIVITLNPDANVKQVRAVIDTKPLLTTITLTQQFGGGTFHYKFESPFTSDNNTIVFDKKVIKMYINWIIVKLGTVLTTLPRGDMCDVSLARRPEGVSVLTFSSIPFRNILGFVGNGFYYFWCRDQEDINAMNSISGQFGILWVGNKVKFGRCKTLSVEHDQISSLLIPDNPVKPAV